MNRKFQLALISLPNVIPDFFISSFKSVVEFGYMFTHRNNKRNPISTAFTVITSPIWAPLIIASVAIASIFNIFKNLISSFKKQMIFSVYIRYVKNYNVSYKNTVKLWEQYNTKKTFDSVRKKTIKKKYHTGKYSIFL